MNHPFSTFATDKIKLIKPDGSTFDDIKAQVRPNFIFVFDVSIRFDEDDIIIRELPNGKIEQYRINNPIYEKGVGGIPDFYKLEVEKTTALPKTKTPSVRIINNINASDHSKVLVDSVDKSVNITTQDLSVFDKLIDAVKDLPDSDKMISEINQMKDSVNNKESFLKKYNDFIQSVAAHITIVAPFIPALTEFLV